MSHPYVADTAAFIAGLRGGGTGAIGCATTARLARLFSKAGL